MPSKHYRVLLVVAWGIDAEFTEMDQEL